MGQISIDQSHAVMAVLATHTDWSQVDFDIAGLQDCVMRNKQQAGCEFLRFLQNGCRVQVVGDHTIDLSSPCRLPFSGAEVEIHRGEGVVKLEKRGDDLYLDGKKITLFLSEEQKGTGRIVGHPLRKKLEVRGGNVSAKVLDHLEDHPELWLESWKKNEDGETLYVFFWGDIFRNPSYGSLYVRFGYWRVGRVLSSYHWLDDGWRSFNPAASLAS